MFRYLYSELTSVQVLSLQPRSVRIQSVCLCSRFRAGSRKVTKWRFFGAGTLFYTDYLYCFNERLIN